jgi:hypothetical protein
LTARDGRGKRGRETNKKRIEKWAQEKENKVLGAKGRANETKKRIETQRLLKNSDAMRAQRDMWEEKERKEEKRKQMKEEGKRKRKSSREYGVEE